MGDLARGRYEVSKASPRVDAYGDVDELNATLGLARSPGSRGSAIFSTVQRDLFIVGADRSLPV
jgi:cob(I)alamin adenosyltransferase